MTIRATKRGAVLCSELRSVGEDELQVLTQPDGNRGESSHSVGDLLVEIQKLRDELSELRSYREIAFQDPLTELRNRRYFELRLSEELNRAQRQPDTQFSLIAIDMDNLKYLNDHYGHSEGDRVLKWVAKFLKAQLRAQDICCRLGGDEFVILLPEADQKGCLRLLHRIGSELEKTDGDFPIPIRLSMGGVTYPEDGTRSAELLEAADRLMYTDKRANKYYPDSVEFKKHQAHFVPEVARLIAVAD